MTTEAQRKIEIVREILRAEKLGGVRLRGVDWFSWATCGGSSVVILTNEAGVADVLITQSGAWVLTDAIEAPRLRDEDVPKEYEMLVSPWAERTQLDEFARKAAAGPLASDRPQGEERALPASLIAAKRRLLPEEIERYRALGRDAAEAMTEALHLARPEWTEWELAAAGAQAMWKRGIHPTLTLTANERRGRIHRHPTPTAEKLGSRAMLVFCGRRHGMYANLTRFVSFREPAAQERDFHRITAQVEAAAFAASRPGEKLSTVFNEMVAAYDRLGRKGEHLLHHQGGTTGYLSREVVANAHVHTTLDDSTALAWNPSLPGAKIEDTVITTKSGIEVLTVDPKWPSIDIEGRKRPDLWVSR